MTSPDPGVATICGATITFPPARCTLAPNHGGRHTTAEIPEPLAGVVADYMLEIERLRSARDMADRHARRMQTLGVVAVVALIVALIVTVWAVSILAGLG